ncbi:MAG: TetR family transcriptional regulator [Parasphingopyxis sp.]|uniref:TetR/AcrR family transcriptional regulator n=1 Tax=Parasphingopyxis sp. TaxID=1920299 RepID=UPI003FA02C47
MASEAPSTGTAPIADRATRTRRAIMDAAAKLFADKGFKATGVRDIAAAAGVNQALVSYHFGGKGALYHDILSEAVDHAAQLAGEADLDSADYPERELVRIFAAAMASRPHLGPMILREQLDPEQLLRPESLTKMLGFMALTEAVLAHIPLREEARRYDPQIVHLTIVGPLIHFLIATRVREAAAQKAARPVSLPTLDEFVETLGDMLSHALRPT